MKLSVTQKDINKGARGWCTLCPIAQAANRTFNSIKSWASLKEIVIKDKTYHVPRSAYRFMRLFDSKGVKAVKPFSFILKEKV